MNEQEIFIGCLAQGDEVALLVEETLPDNGYQGIRVDQDTKTISLVFDNAAYCASNVDALLLETLAMRDKEIAIVQGKNGNILLEKGNKPKIIARGRVLKS